MPAAQFSGATSVQADRTARAAARRGLQGARGHVLTQRSAAATTHAAAAAAHRAAGVPAHALRARRVTATRGRERREAEWCKASRSSLLGGGLALPCTPARAADTFESLRTRAVRTVWRCAVARRAIRLRRLTTHATPAPWRLNFVARAYHRVLPRARAVCRLPRRALLTAASQRCLCLRPDGARRNDAASEDILWPSSLRSSLARLLLSTSLSVPWLQWTCRVSSRSQIRR
jgi:hypothetical protein